MPRIGLIVVGDEILSGKRADKHMPKLIELLSERGLQLDYAHFVGDSPQRITHTLAQAFESDDVVFSCGGIGATPDDHTRQCAAKALKVELAMHPTAQALIIERMKAMAGEKGFEYEPDNPDNIHRLNMGVFPVGAQIIPNPYNKIPGFSCQRHKPLRDLAPVNFLNGGVHFLPGFPVMAWPMMAWVLDTYYQSLFQKGAWVEQSIIVFGSMEATLTPLMLTLEQQFEGVKVFSLPSVDHPEYGRHIELGVKGSPSLVKHAYPALLQGLQRFDIKLGPELVR